MRAAGYTQDPQGGAVDRRGSTAGAGAGLPAAESDSRTPRVDSHLASTPSRRPTLRTRSQAAPPPPPQKKKRKRKEKQTNKLLAVAARVDSVGCGSVANARQSQKFLDSPNLPGRRRLIPTDNAGNQDGSVEACCLFPPAEQVVSGKSQPWLAKSRSWCGRINYHIIDLSAPYFFKGAPQGVF